MRLPEYLVVVALLGSASGMAGSAERTGRLGEAMQPDALVLLTSYGEKANDLIELLVPFLARHGFGMVHPRHIDANGVATASFQSMKPMAYGRDFIVVSGRYNCLLVGYFSSQVERLSAPANGILRSVQFRVDLEGFVQSLPTPRLRTEDLVWGKKQITCSS
jgi:hypothetical protein